MMNKSPSRILSALSSAVLAFSFFTFLQTASAEILVKSGEKINLNEDFQKRIKAENKPGQKVLTADGVHMNTEGNKVMATGILRAFGLDEPEIKKAQESWAPLEAAAEEAAKKAAEAKAKADAAKAAAAAAATAPGAK